MSTDAYLDAKAAFERADGDLDAIAKMLGQVAQAISHQRSTFSFSNTGIGLPAEAMFSQGSSSVDANHWPSAQQIMEKIAAWHSAKDAMMTAWGAVPNDRKAGLVPPPGAPRRTSGYR